MTAPPIPPPRNRASGFWATVSRQGYDGDAVWAAASHALAAVFDVSSMEARDLLDSDLGQLLGDDIGFIDGDARDADAIEDLLRSRLHHLGWRRLYMRAIAHLRGETPGKT